MSIVKEFKEFAIKGNVIDLAVGVIIGAAFGKIVSSFVADVVMPPLGLLTSGIDFKDLAYTLQAAHGDKPAVLLKYGVFLQSIIDFLLVAIVIFLVVKGINSMKRAEAAAAPAPEPSKQELLLTEIRDALVARK
jgi:large conductance mechanosensitive channel